MLADQLSEFAERQPFAAIADSLAQSIAGLSGRLDAERKASTSTTTQLGRGYRAETPPSTGMIAPVT